MRWVFKAKKIAELQLRPWDSNTDCFSIINIFHAENGGVYYNFSHEDAIYCPLKNIPLEYCHSCDCKNCPEASFFIVDENGVKHPVKKLV
ncbi:MAG: hypothetical protein LM575_06910 [Caldimicrobium sp.]|nr:hypothetical protein [Caldimicrobium sp.]